MKRDKILNKNIKKFNSLLEKIAQKKKGALEVFYDKYGQLIYITAQTIVKSKFITDEVVNDVLFKIWTLAPSLKISKNPEGWLYSITVNCAKDKIKYKKIYSELPDIATKDSEIEKILDEDAFYNDIKDLNTIEQKILVLKFLFDLTFEEIATKLRKTTVYISTTYYRALDKIKEKIK